MNGLCPRGMNQSHTHYVASLLPTQKLEDLDENNIGRKEELLQTLLDSLRTPDLDIETRIRKFDLAAEHLRFLLRAYDHCKENHHMSVDDRNSVKGFLAGYIGQLAFQRLSIYDQDPTARVDEIFPQLPKPIKSVENNYGPEGL